MPNPERNLYSNKESAKVNSGLPFDASKVNHEEQEDSSSKAFNTNTSAVDMDFSEFLVPIVAPEPAPSVKTLVHRLLQPPEYAFVHGILSIQWVRGVIGHKHIAFREKDERYVLAGESELRLSGRECGLPALYLEWLCGDDEDLSAAEQGVCLTPEYFEEVAEG
ncbi:hypothetical protein FB567DRAFT_451800 [Paraphoma chrysanthemicola]|uniref:Uncharacterized protein n=1 Tax=Paraphoma chrysanthemicola TaxID=798071 RepID=A0A8K0QX39_9PLEO|nr:hypothetical protein FB567DRAFT_451800 [Paraphoma chrysanthemicola]